MKTLINVILSICAIGLVYICYGSIMGPINFDSTKNLREKQIKARLIDIRKAEIEFAKVNKGRYTASFDTLIAFVKNAKLPFVRKEGVLTDDQLDAGMTEAKAVKLGLIVRDTTWIAVKDTIFAKGFDADSLSFVPFGNGAKFELNTNDSQKTKSGAPIHLFEAKVPFNVYLEGINEQELINLNDTQKKLNKYQGLKVGDVENPNNNAGNWE